MNTVHSERKEPDMITNKLDTKMDSTERVTAILKVESKPFRRVKRDFNETLINSILKTKELSNVNQTEQKQSVKDVYNLIEKLSIL